MGRDILGGHRSVSCPEANRGPARDMTFWRVTQGSAGVLPIDAALPLESAMLRKLQCRNIRRGPGDREDPGSNPSHARRP